MRKPIRNSPLQAINGHCLMCGYRLAWILVQGRKSALEGSDCSSFIPLKLFVFRSSRTKAGRQVKQPHISGNLASCMLEGRVGCSSIHALHNSSPYSSACFFVLKHSAVDSIRLISTVWFRSRSKTSPREYH